MKNWERKLAPGGLAVAGLVFLIAAVKPVIAGLPLNVTFLLIGLACLVLGIAVWRRSNVGDAS